MGIIALHMHRVIASHRSRDETQHTLLAVALTRRTNDDERLRVIATAQKRRKKRKTNIQPIRSNTLCVYNAD